MNQTNYGNNIKDTLDELEKNYTRELIRWGVSYCLLDYYIDRWCLKHKQCPPIVEDDHSFLINISIEKYILTKARLYSKEQEGVDDKDRYFKALTHIHNILNCKNICSLKNELFYNHITPLKENHGKIYKSIRNRKAYWTYLKYDPYNDPIKDYEGACGFVEKFHMDPLGLIENNGNTVSFTWDNFQKEIIYNNFHIMNGFELYQACLIKNLLRKKLNCKAPIPTKTTMSG